MADQPTDVLNEAIKRSAEIAFMAVERMKAGMPNPIGQVPDDSPKLSKADIDRLRQR